MTRPLLPLGIGQLEAMFAQLPDDLPQLEILLAELQVRSTPKAIALRAQVSKAISVLKGDDLFSTGRTTTNTPEIDRAPPVAPHTATHTSPHTAPPKNLSPTPPSTGETQAVPAQQMPASKPAAITTATPPPSVVVAPANVTDIGLEEAYAFYKIKSSERWEIVEQLRREIVGRSSPSAMMNLNDKEKVVRRAEAKLANAAYFSILRTRHENL
jgi:hypothetical protein